MKKARIGSLLSMLFVSLSILASSGPRIKGRLIESGKNTPIEFADVVLSKKGKTTAIAHAYSEENGQFILSDIEDGEYTLMIRVVGYDIYTKTPVTLTPAITILDLGVVELKPLENELSEVVVEADKRQVIYKLDKRIIDASANLMGAGGSAVDILENTPSIRIDAEGEVTFRGSSGFAVFVNGKISMLSGTQALQQIPAGMIENIEIITNPSARHDTGGDVGIINIITKKNYQQGFNGMVNVFGSTALSNGLDFMLAKQNKNLQWSLSGSWNEPIRKSHFDQDKTTIVDGITTISHSKGPRKSITYNTFIRNGWIYSLPKTALNLDLEIGYNKKTRKGNLDYTEVRSENGNIFETGDANSRDYYDLHATYYQGNAGFDHRFNEDGHKLSGSFLLRYEGDALEYFQSDLFDKNNERLQGHRAWEDEHRWTVQANADYILPYSKTGKFEGGYQYFSYLEDGDYSMQFWDPEKKEFYWRDDIYNTFYFQRGIHSIYAMGSDSYKAFDLQLGLRGEHTHQVLRSSIEGSNRTVNRFEVFPSVHLGYNLPNNHKLIFSYSYRTTRPQLFYMEPYITYRDYYTAEIGNPDIRPEYIHSYELNYKKNINEHIISSSLFYRYRKDKIERLRVPYSAGVTLDSMANVGNDRSMGIELNGQLKATNKWNININGNIYYYKVENKFKLDGKNETSTNYDITINNLIDVHKNTRIQFDGNFVGPSVTTQGRSDSFWFMNFAIRQQLFQRKLLSTLSFRDVFNTARYKSDIRTANLESVTHIRPQYPVIMLTLSYTFNNFKKKSVDSRDNRDLFEGTNH
ncbi:TonB-dependent receptor domain-containing protein [Dysgonomonas sp. ZJ279]|uniref:TonB-dependent receptor domain-containing protein n=1 Tax=Dysgonomonas sp. ZJ279 TaxID=2709796 RepID=UPI0013EC6B30|nr:TonB-dependent receptor [Dysgonomonas sp. ZJ279]